MAYKVLERDEKGYATHTIDDGVEDWIENYYTPDGKFKDLRVIHLRVPPGYRSEWTGTVWPDGYDYYSKYNDDGELIAEYDTNRANNSFYLNWNYSHWHIDGVNKVKGLTYEEYKDWCTEIGVYMNGVTINGSASIGYLYEHFEIMRVYLEEFYKFNKDFVLYPGFTKINHNGEEKILMRPFIKGPVGLFILGLVEEPANESQGKTKPDAKPYIAHVYEFPGDFDVNQFYEHKGNYNG